MKIGFYVDNNIMGKVWDSSREIMDALVDRGHEVLYFEPGSLEGNVNDMINFKKHNYWRSTSGEKIHEKEPEIKEGKIVGLDGLVIRKDPPVDHVAYGKLSSLEEQLPMFNPASLIMRDTKKYMNQDFLKPYVPNTKFLSNPKKIESAVKQYGKAVIKPVDGCAGKGIFIVESKEYDQYKQKINEATEEGKKEIVVQEYLNDVVKGDKRVGVFDGKIVGAALRVPKNQDSLANRAQGGTIIATEVTEKEKEIIDKTWPHLREQGMIYAGYDFIGEKLTELNFSTPALFSRIWYELYHGEEKTPDERVAEGIIEYLK